MTKPAKAFAISSHNLLNLLPWLPDSLLKNQSQKLPASPLLTNQTIKIYVTNSRPALHASMPTNITSSAVSASEDSSPTKVSAKQLTNAVDTYLDNQTNSPAQKISRPPTAEDGYATMPHRHAMSPKTVNTQLKLNAWSHALKQRS